MMSWSRSFLMYEGLVAIAGAAAMASILAYYENALDVENLDKPQLLSIIAILASLYGSMLGFLLAVMTLLYGAVDQSRFMLLRKSKRYANLWGVFRSAIRSCAISLIASVLSLIWIWLKRPGVGILIITSGFFILVVVRMARVVWILEKLMDIEVARGLKERQLEES